MSRSIQNAFARRDYWVVVPVTAVWLNLAYNVLRGSDGHWEIWYMGAVALGIQSAILILPLVYSRWAPWVVLADLIAYIGNLAINALIGSYEKTSFSAFTLGVLLGILSVILFWRRHEVR